MYIVKAKGTATYPTRVGEIPSLDNWTNGKIQVVDDALIQWYRDHSDVFTVVAANGTVTTNDGLEDVTGLSAFNTTNDGIIHQTVFTLTDVAQAIVNGTEYQGTKLFTFPQGRINVLGVLCSMKQKTTTALDTTLNASSTGAFSLGTVEAASTTLATDKVDLLPSTEFTSSATVNVAGSVFKNALAAAAQFDGTTTAIAMWMNSAFATTTDVDGNATQKFTGTITVTWVLLGDY